MVKTTSTNKSKQVKKTTRTSNRGNTTKKNTVVKQVKKTKEVPKTEINRKNSNFLVTFIRFIIALSIIIVIFYFIYVKFIKIANYEVDYSNKVLNREEINKLAMEKYNWMNDQKSNENFAFMFFTDKSVDINTISIEDVLASAYRTTDSKDRLLSGNCKDNTCSKENFSKSILEEQIKNHYSHKLKIKYVDFWATGTYKCNINGDYYNCDVETRDLKNDRIIKFNGYLSSEMENDNLIVYTTLISIKSDDSGYPDNEKGIYAGNDITKRIDNLNEYNKISDNLNYTNIQELINHYKDKLPVYKSTFVMENNYYVWLKTELQ